MTTTAALPPLSSVPDARGHFGPYGGTFVPETLVYALQQLELEYNKAKADPQFKKDFDFYMREFVGRPSRLLWLRLTMLSARKSPAISLSRK